MLKNPWKTLSSKVVYKNKYFSVKHNKVLSPLGKKGDYFVRAGRDGVFIVPVDETGKVLLIRQWRYPLGLLTWEVPAGSHDQKTMFATAKKELLEETGLKAKRISKAGSFYLSAGRSKQRAFVFLATGLTKAGYNQQAEEGIAQEKKFSWKQLAAMIKTGKIMDGQSICALTLAKLYLTKL